MCNFFVFLYFNLRFKQKNDNHRPLRNVMRISNNVTEKIIFDLRIVA
jgi:hypothetical protein